MSKPQTSSSKRCNVPVNAQSFKQVGETLEWITHLKIFALSDMYLTIFSLAKRINQVISFQLMTERARALVEDGLTTDVKLIEAFATEVCLNHHYTS